MAQARCRALSFPPQGGKTQAEAQLTGRDQECKNSRKWYLGGRLRGWDRCSLGNPSLGNNGVTVQMPKRLLSQEKGRALLGEGPTGRSLREVDFRST